MSKASRQNEDNNYSIFYLPTLKLHPNLAVFYYQRISDKPRNRFVFWFPEDDSEKKKPYSGEITEHSKRRMRRALEILFSISPRKWIHNPTTGKKYSFRIALQTLTLSAEQGNISDRQIKKDLLEPYLRKMREKGMRDYVWKAERQKNGNLHFHILTNTFIPAGEIRLIWNRLQYKLGFITKFYEKHGHYDPNSIDVKKVKNESGMVNYMLKYMLKEVDKSKSLEEDEERESYNTGKVWDCSLNLKIPNDTEHLMEDEDYDLINRGEDAGVLERKEEEHFSIIKIHNSEGLDYIPKPLLKQFNEYLERVKNHIFEKPPKAPPKPLEPGH